MESSSMYPYTVEPTQDGISKMRYFLIYDPLFMELQK